MFSESPKRTYEEMRASYERPESQQAFRNAIDPYMEAQQMALVRELRERQRHASLPVGEMAMFAVATQ